MDSTRLSIPNCTSIGSAGFAAQLTAESPYKRKYGEWYSLHGHVPKKIIEEASKCSHELVPEDGKRTRGRPQKDRT